MMKKKKPGDSSDSLSGSSHSAKHRSGESTHHDKEKKRTMRNKADFESSRIEKLPDGSPETDSLQTASQVTRQRDMGAGETASQPGDMEQAEREAQATQQEELVRELKDQLLRKQAEFENFRKRLSREKADGIRYSNQMLLLDLLPVIDGFERAIASAEESKDFHAFHDGVVLIERQLTSLLEKNWGLKRFDSLGEEFNPEKHQAIALEESTDISNPTVVEDYQKGYFYHDRVLRPAKVKVAQPKNISGQPDNHGVEESQGE